MKYLLKPLIVAVISIPLIVSCQKNKDTIPEPGYLATDKKAAELISADNAFAFDLLYETDKLNEKDNYMISPLSVAIALGMAYNGSENDTRLAFEHTLRLNGLSRHEINRIHGDLQNYLKKADGNVNFEIANSIWVNYLYTLNQSFADTNSYYYHAEVANIDFFSGNAEDIINSWVSDNTHEKILSVIDEIPGDAVMYLINAIYFNGPWKYAFDEDETAGMGFHYDDGTAGNVMTMRMESDVKFYSNDTFKAIQLPYGNGNFVMDVILPDDNKTVSDATLWLTGHNDGKWFDDFNEAKGLLIKLPKFKFEYDNLLNDPLTEMGLGIAFTGSADFSSMFEDLKSLAISKVIHKTYIDVSEKGTEAAAVTAIEMETTSAMEPSSFIVDKPFLFTIREKNTGAVIFTGKVGRPVYE